MAVQERTIIKLDPGMTTKPANPVIEVVPGSRPYLWIGDDNACFATVGPGKARLRALRDALNEALGDG